MLAIVACTEADEPWPISTMAMTAATPMTMPSVVSADRITLRRKARMATTQRAEDFERTHWCGWELKCPALLCCGSIQARLDDASSAVVSSASSSIRPSRMWIVRSA